MRQDLWTDPDAEPSGDKIWAEAGADGVPGAGSAPRDGLLQNVPDSLRPGSNAAFSDFEQEEESVWSQPGLDLASPNTTMKEPERVFADVPAALKPGGPGALRPETNPFKKKATPGSSQEAVDLPPAAPPTDVEAPTMPARSLSQLSGNETSNNPWQPALDQSRLSPGPPPLLSTASDPDSGRSGWSSPEPSRESSRKPSTQPLSNSPALLPLTPEEEGSAAWDEIASPQQKAPPVPPAPIGSTDPEVFEDRHAWDDVDGRGKGKAPAVIPTLQTEATGEGWNLIDDPLPGQLSKQSTWENFEDAEEHPPKQPGPVLPPRTSDEAPPPQPPRPVDKAETYQIKNINWYDINAAKNPRTSPILVQNANGPCPLVALVNALTLTTPADVETALVETLRSREQVSLGLLLDAVFDELMSSRRTNEESQLPDVTELYAFLKGLHTGMNVNPRFVPTPEIVTAFKRTSLTHLHPAERGDMIPGTFEDTKEMKLYAAFSIPLIHGWIPPKSEDVYEALQRRAESYEDVQNLLFREEELEDKLSNPSQLGLSEEEQEIYQDILTIKSFLSISATQLTPWGLEVITQAMKPGSVAILFRNDHFATLYRHPQTLSLLALVTDAGYAGHEEVVWESLVDVNGLHSEFFSGDFRLVGGAQLQQEAKSAGKFPGAATNEADWPSIGSSSSAAPSGWTTVQGGRKKPNQQQQDPPLSPKHEQEDRDLALALQLQEEEEERHRAEEARRRRESMLSEQYIEQQARQPGPGAGAGRGRGGAVGTRGGRLGQPITGINPRRSSSGVAVPVTTNASDRGRSASVTINNRGRGGAAPMGQTVRPLVPPAGSSTANVRPAVNRPADDGVEDAPPSYEQASLSAPYTPPAGHPSHPASSPDGPGAPGPSAQPVRNPAAMGPGGLPRTNTGGSIGYGRGGLRQGVPPPVGSTVGTGGRDRDCVVM